MNSDRAIADSTNSTCKLVKEPNQCCPTIRCGTQQDPNAAASQSSTTTVNQRQSTADQSSSNDNDVSSSSEHSVVVSNRSMADSSSENMSPAAASRTTATTNMESEPRDPHQLPKLTVINGFNGQRDSILLITSNPQNSLQRSSMNGSSSTGLTATTIDSSHNNGALLDALLETVYTSATGSQLNGFNLQGSCLLNGSLYVEGSAVMPPKASGSNENNKNHNSACQYCYCIRQRVMCVKPKCHLSISGCVPKYNNEFACCPTSYSCTSPSSPATASALLAAMANSDKQHRSSYGMNHNDNNDLNNSNNRTTGALATARLSPGGLAEKLSALFDSFARLTRSASESLAATGGSGGTAAAGSSSGVTLTERTFGGGNERLNESSVEFSNASTAVASSTTTMAPELTSGRSKKPEQSDGSINDNADGDGSDDGDDGGDNNESPEVPVRTESASTTKAPSKRYGSTTTAAPTDIPATTTRSTGASGSNGNGNGATSVSDFLEPMNKLGPMVVASPNGCTENGRHYAIGEQIPTLERCKHCYCGLDGLKECKMIECSLKGSHDCRPVIPEGHCCPIRYECPSLPANGSAAVSTTNGQSLQSARFRSSEAASGAALTNEAANDLSNNNPFQGVRQCASTTGLGEDCAPLNNSNQATTTTTEATSVSNTPDDIGQANGLEHIRGLSIGGEDDNSGGGDDDGSTTGAGARSLTGDIGPLLQNHHYITETDNGSGSSSFSANRNETALAEELSKFIMQIRANASLDNNNLLQGNLHNVTPTFTSTRTTTTENPLFGTTAITTANYPNSDYHTVQPEARSQPPPIPSGMMGIPSIEPETIKNSFGGGLAPPYADNNGPLGGVSPQVDLISQPPALFQPTPPTIINSVRDSRSADSSSGTRLQTNTDSLNEPGGDFGTTDSGPHSNGTGGWIGLPANRALMNLNNSSSPVVFDDELSNALNRSGLGKRLADDGFNSAVDNTRANHNDFNLSALLTNNHNNEIDAGSNDDQTSSPTPLPPQPTTGTPIGLEADRTPETRGWLKSLSGIVQSFGRRLNSNNGNNPNIGFGDGLQGAATSEGDLPVIPSAPDNISSSSPRHQPAEAQTSGRSARQQTSLWDQLLATMIGTPGEKATSTVPRIEGDRSANAWQPLVMRPLASLLSTPAVTVRPVQQPSDNMSTRQRGRFHASVMPPYEPMQGSQSEQIEIVTAATPSDPEVFGGSKSQSRRPMMGDDSLQVVVGAKSSFERRSDVADVDVADSEADDHASRQVDLQASSKKGSVLDEPLIGAENGKVLRLFAKSTNDSEHQVLSFSNLTSSEDADESTNDSNSQRTQLNKLTCFDPLTNRTYQQSEIIKKDDPCKTCTCVLGEELCQTMICPQKPNANCREELKDGQCCPTYLCGSNTDSLEVQKPDPFIESNNKVPPPVNIEAQPRSPDAVNNQPSARMILGSSQQSMNTDMNQRTVDQIQRSTASMFSPSNNNFGPMSQNLLAQSMQTANLNINPYRPSAAQQQVPIRHEQQQRTAQAPSTAAPALTIGNLASFLPPHLRFKPTTTHATGPNYLILRQADQMSAKRQFRFPLSTDNAQIGTSESNLMPPRLDNQRQGIVNAPQRSPAAPFVGPNWRAEFSGHANSNLNLGPNRWTNGVNPLPTANNAITNLLRHPMLKNGPAAGNQPNNQDGGVVSFGLNMVNGIRRSSSDGEIREFPPARSDIGLMPATRGSPVPQTVANTNNNSPPSNNLPKLTSITQRQQQVSTSSGKGFSAPQGWLPNNVMHSINQVPLNHSPLDAPGLGTTDYSKVRVVFQNDPTSTQTSTMKTNKFDAIPTTSFPSSTSFVPSYPQMDAGFVPISFSNQSPNEQTTNPPTRDLGSNMEPKGALNTVMIPKDQQQDDNLSHSQTPNHTEKPAGDMNTSSFGSDSHVVSAAQAITNPPTPTSSQKSAIEINTEQGNSSVETNYDPFGLFKVSECNIYGRLYKVGQEISELSDDCKYCSCTSTGVDCQQRCNKREVAA